MASTDPILIAGGGIGGLSAGARSGEGRPALNRSRTGRPQIKEIGAGIQLGPKRVPRPSTI